MRYYKIYTNIVEKKMDNKKNPAKPYHFEIYCRSALTLPSFVNIEIIFKKMK